MRHLHPSDRFLIAGLFCSALVLLAGVVATTNTIGIAVASTLLTFASMLLVPALASLRAPGSGIAYSVLVAAALPLFFAFYGVGLAVLRYLGRGPAGQLLIALSAVLAVGTCVVAVRMRHPVPH